MPQLVDRPTFEEGSSTHAGPNRKGRVHLLRQANRLPKTIRDDRETRQSG